MPVGNGGVIGPANIPTTSIARGVWSLKEAFLAQKQGIWPVPNYADPYFEYTALLLPGNGTNGAQNNTFLDASTNNFTITRNGNTTQGTFSPFSQTGWGNYFAGSYLTVPASADFNLGTNDFCIEFWLNAISAATYGGVLSFDSGDYPVNFSYASAAGSNLQANFGSASAWYFSANFDTSTATNQWDHYVATRSGSTFRLFKNGVLKATGTNSGSIGASSGTININANGTAAGTTYLSNLRIINGSIPTNYQTSSTTVGTTIFTVPTSPLTTTSQGATAGDVKLLTCQSNRFIDNSASPKTITVTGSPSVQAFSPFNPTSSWSATTNGGSGYFDGNTDYLTAASNAAYNFSGNFTIEAWVYLLSFSQTNTIIDTRNGDVLGAYIFNVTTSQKLDFLFASSGTTRITSTNNVSLNTWTHVVVSRASGTLRLFINGNQEASTTTSAAINALSFPSIGGGRAGATDVVNGYYLNGYINGLRVLNGTGYSTITVPTAPLTAITNTSLLLNFTNAGIYDGTSKNDLETVGNAQISTAQSKWGGSSMSFDGTGDWLLIPDQPIQRIGTGNFTVEGWVYRNSSGTYGLIGKGTGTTGWLVSLNSSNQVVFTYGSSTITSTGTVSATTWTHIAVVREGTSTNQTKIYINGTNDGTGTVSTDFNQTNSMYVGADRTGGSAANAYMQDVRVTNYARYTANFTAPTAAFLTL